MCTCLWVEYCCECNKPHCPHKQPSHPHYHVQDKLWQIDHKAWRYCPAFIQVLDSVKQELQDAIPKYSGSGASNDDRGNSTSQHREEAAIVRPSKCFKNSTDPRHDGRIPLCEDLRYSAWRIVKNCGYCRDYWVGQSMDNAV